MLPPWLKNLLILCFIINEQVQDIVNKNFIVMFSHYLAAYNNPTSCIFNPLL